MTTTQAILAQAYIDAADLAMNADSDALDTARHAAWQALVTVSGSESAALDAYREATGQAALADARLAKARERGTTPRLASPDQPPSENTSPQSADSADPDPIIPVTPNPGDRGETMTQAIRNRLSQPQRPAALLAAMAGAGWSVKAASAELHRLKAAGQIGATPDGRLILRPVTTAAAETLEMSQPVLRPLTLDL